MPESNYRKELQLLFDAAESFVEPALGHRRPWVKAMDRARVALAKPKAKTRLAIEPVAVTERLPEPEDCDGKGRCWIFDPGDHVSGPVWAFEGSEEFQWLKTQDEDKVQQASQRGRLTWLPHYALPLPTRGFI